MRELRFQGTRRVAAVSVTLLAVGLAVTGCAPASQPTPSASPTPAQPEPFAIQAPSLPGVQTYGGSYSASLGSYSASLSGVTIGQDGSMTAVGWAPSDGDFAGGAQLPTSGDYGSVGVGGLVIHVDAQGSAWALFPGGDSIGSLKSVALAGDGDIIAVGGPLMGAGAATIVRIHPDGTLVWARDFSAMMASFFAVALGADGDIVVAGYTTSSDGDSTSAPPGVANALLAKFTPDGDLMWANTYGEASGDAGSLLLGVAVTSDGGVVAVGWGSAANGSFGCPGGHPGGQCGIAVRAAADGSTVWREAVPQTSNLQGVAVASDGSVLVVGSSDGYMALVSSLTGDGAVNWTATQNNSTFNSVAIAPGGTALVAGDSTLAKVNPDGSLGQVRTTELIDSTFYGVAVGPDGGAVAVGEVASPSSSSTAKKGTLAVIARLLPDSGQ